MSLALGFLPIVWSWNEEHHWPLDDAHRRWPVRNPDRATRPSKRERQAMTQAKLRTRPADLDQHR